MFPPGSIPSPACLNLGLYGYTYSDYNEAFLDSTYELVFQSLYFDENSGT